MFTAQQSQVKHAEEGALPDAPRSPGEDREFRALEQTRATMTENEQWLVRNADKVLPTSQYEIVPTSEYDDNRRAVFVKEDEYVLQCLGTAVLMRWSTLPAKVQRELFEHASSLGEFDEDSSASASEQAARLKGLIARFLHAHNGPSAK
jgi:hypothetical protein